MRSLYLELLCPGNSSEIGFYFGYQQRLLLGLTEADDARDEHPLDEISDGDAAEDERDNQHDSEEYGQLTAKDNQCPAGVKYKEPVPTQKPTTAG